MTGDCLLLIWFSWNHFLCLQYKFFYVFKDGADLMMASFSCKRNKCEWFQLFDDIPFAVEVDVFVFFISKSKRDR